MHGSLMLMIVALVHPVLSAMVMDLLMELIAQILQSRAGSDAEEGSSTPHPVSPQEEQAQEIPSTLAPDTQQDGNPRPPPASGPPDPTPMPAWAVPPSNHVLDVVAVTRLHCPALLPARFGPFL